MTDPLENELASAIQEDATIKAMAQKLAPRDFTQHGLSQAQVGMQKRSMVPAEHFTESLGTLEKTLVDLQSLRTRLIGEAEPSGKNRVVPIGEVKLPVVGLLHQQATEVARIASEMASIIAQIRERI
jgi:hypothetical protein